MMQRSLAELKSQCNKMDLQVGMIGKKEAKKDYVTALQNHYYKSTVKSFGLEFRMMIETPQLCFLSTGLREEEQREIFNSPDWVVEEKLNGIRMVVSYHPDYGFEFYSRNLSLEDFLPVCYTDKIWLGDQNFKRLFDPFVIDCEIMSRDKKISTVMGKKGVITETELQAVAALLAMNSEDSIRIQKELDQPLELKVFDCLYADWEDIRNLSYIERRKRIDSILGKMSILKVKSEKVAAIRKNKKEYLDFIWSMGGEGVVAKRLDMPYLSKESRPRNGWVKFKRTASGSIGDSVDGFITGFDLGDKEKGYADLVGSLTISINLTDIEEGVKEHEIARVSNIPLEIRNKITIVIGGKPTLDPSYYNKVVEVDGQSISARAMRLNHPRLIRFREDKNPDQCIMEKSTLLRLIV